MNLDEAQALCDGSNAVHFCSEPGFDHLVCLYDNWYDAEQLQAWIDTYPAELRDPPLLQAALIVLRDKIAKHAAAEREVS